MAGNTNTGIVIDISGRLTNGEEIFKGLQSQLNKLDLRCNPKMLLSLVKKFLQFEL